MREKRGLVIMCFIAFFGVLVGYVMTHMIMLSFLGFCIHPLAYTFYYISSLDCGDRVMFPIGYALSAFSFSLLATLTLLFFIRNEVFRSWLRWGGVIIVASFFLSLIREVYVFNIYTMAKDFSIVFFFLSLIFIFWQSSKKQR